jgi:hypothetical protein
MITQKIAENIMGVEVVEIRSGQPILASGQPPTPAQQTIVDLALNMDWTPVSEEDTLEQAKGKKKVELKNHRDLTWKADLVASFGFPFNTDIQTQIDIQLMISILEPAEAFTGYKCADGVRRDITREQFQLALQEGVARKVTAYAIEGQKAALVDAATAKEELDAITFE